jgi:hypothetical protein
MPREVTYAARHDVLPEALLRGSLWRGKRCQNSGFQCCGPAECQSPASVGCADIFVRFKSVVWVTIMSAELCISKELVITLSEILTLATLS